MPFHYLQRTNRSFWKHNKWAQKWQHWETSGRVFQMLCCWLKSSHSPVKELHKGLRCLSHLIDDIRLMFINLMGQIVLFLGHKVHWSQTCFSRSFKKFDSISLGLSQDKSPVAPLPQMLSNLAKPGNTCHLWLLLKTTNSLMAPSRNFLLWVTPTAFIWMLSALHKVVPNNTPVAFHGTHICYILEVRWPNLFNVRATYSKHQIMENHKRDALRAAIIKKHLYS